MAEFHAPAPDRDGVRRNIGTLWTLTRAESSARCALVSVATGLELRVMLDGAILRAEACKQYSEAFELAERWRARMMDRGWVPLRS